MAAQINSQTINNPTLLGILHLNLNFETKTGLLISAGRTLARIGGSDIENMSIEKEYFCGSTEEQVKQVLVRVPYIPGSSLKGRMRSLLELKLGLPLYTTDGKIWSHTISPNVQTLNKEISPNVKTVNEESNKLVTIEPTQFIKHLKDCVLDKVFGYNSFSVKDFMENNKVPKDVIELINKLSPTILLVEDFYPSNDYVCEVYKQQNNFITFSDFLEDKSENRIDRITSVADPRVISRVKTGVKFEGKISLLVFENTLEKLKEELDLVVKGLKLIENTYLGASGSRGYGRVKFTKINIKLYNAKTDTSSDLGDITDLSQLKVEDIVNKVKEAVK